jgi:hypothetical protein
VGGGGRRAGEGRIARRTTETLTFSAAATTRREKPIERRTSIRARIAGVSNDFI